MSHKPIEVLIPRIALAEAKYIGPRYAQLFLERMGSVEAIFASQEALRRAFPRQRERLVAELYRQDLWQRARLIAEWCISEGVELYFVGDADYPSRLRECADAPIVLYAKGQYQDWDNELALSVVGTRNITSYGQRMTEHILKDLHSLSPHTLIVSGLAYGVDIAAHREALALGLPTVAVLAHGFDRIYPASHRAIAYEILKYGAWVSEYPPGTNPDRYNFVARNRIIAGLTAGTLVVEAGLKSGSLITAELARDYDREVLVVPGRVGDKYSEGCNQLISKMTGALVSSGQDVAKLMAWDLYPSAQGLQSTIEFPPSQEAPEIDNPIYALVAEKQPIQLNDIVRQTGMSVAEVSAALFDLEIDGYVRAMPGGLFTLNK